MQIGIALQLVSDYTHWSIGNIRNINKIASCIALRTYQNITRSQRREPSALEIARARVRTKWRSMFRTSAAGIMQSALAIPMQQMARYSCLDKVYGPPIESDTILCDNYFRKSGTYGANHEPFTSPAKLIKTWSSNWMRSLFSEIFDWWTINLVAAWVRRPLWGKEN